MCAYLLMRVFLYLNIYCVKLISFFDVVNEYLRALGRGRYMCTSAGIEGRLNGNVALTSNTF